MRNRLVVMLGSTWREVAFDLANQHTLSCQFQPGNRDREIHCDY
ncbi:hypothetical protein NIES2104_48860 [Leptolyngbya sp. NIES-2104]|nr:hypothetical protein NIES2104_48860 [Leptolyngbya sp. NIES-2104]